MVIACSSLLMYSKLHGQLECTSSTVKKHDVMDRKSKDQFLNVCQLVGEHFILTFYTILAGSGSEALSEPPVIHLWPNGMQY